MGTPAPVITIDGPLGSGKGTIAACLADRLGWRLLDSGALYRLVAVAAVDAGLRPDDEDALIGIARSMDCDFQRQGGEVVARLNGVDVSDRLRSHEVSNVASRVAAVPGVRSALAERQRAFAQPPGLVADGRDMGTIIFPEAVLKIFLTASVEARASRRYKQLKEKGESVNLSRLFRDIETRDHRDMTRSVAPLRPADDAVIIDSTEMSIDQVLEELLQLVEERNLTN